MYTAGNCVVLPVLWGIPVRKTQKVEYGLSGTIIKCTQCHATIFSPDTIAKFDGSRLVNRPVLNHIELGIAKWNTRPAPPVGRCGEELDVKIYDMEESK